MKAHIDFLGTVLEKQLTVKNVSHMLSEGEGFTETMRLERGSTYMVTTEGWPDMDAVTIRLDHENGEAVVPEVDNETAALYFAPRRTGLHRLRVVMAAVWKLFTISCHPCGVLLLGLPSPPLRTEPIKNVVTSAGWILPISTWVIWPIFSSSVMRASKSSTRASIGRDWSG